MGWDNYIFVLLCFDVLKNIQFVIEIRNIVKLFGNHKNAPAENSQPNCRTYGGRAYRAEHKINLNYEWFMQRESELLLKNLHIFWGENNDVLMVLVPTKLSYVPTSWTEHLGPKRKKNVSVPQWPFHCCRSSPYLLFFHTILKEQWADSCVRDERC